MGFKNTNKKVALKEALINDTRSGRQAGFCSGMGKKKPQRKNVGA
jgi:hypothetical protein